MTRVRPVSRKVLAVTQTSVSVTPGLTMTVKDIL